MTEVHTQVLTRGFRYDDSRNSASDDNDDIDDIDSSSSSGEDLFAAFGINRRNRRVSSVASEVSNSQPDLSGLRKRRAKRGGAQFENQDQFEIHAEPENDKNTDIGEEPEDRTLQTLLIKKFQEEALQNGSPEIVNSTDVPLVRSPVRSPLNPLFGSEDDTDEKTPEIKETVQSNEWLRKPLFDNSNGIDQISSLFNPIPSFSNNTLSRSSHNNPLPMPLGYANGPYFGQEWYPAYQYNMYQPQAL